MDSFKELLLKDLPTLVWQIITPLTPSAKIAYDLGYVNKMEC